ncbi:hypothetical protein [Nostoc sp.]
MKLRTYWLRQRQLLETLRVGVGEAFGREASGRVVRYPAGSPVPLCR